MLFHIKDNVLGKGGTYFATIPECFTPLQLEVRNA